VHGLRAEKEESVPTLGIAAASAPAPDAAVTILGLGEAFWVTFAIVGWLVVLAVTIGPLRRPLERARARLLPDRLPGWLGSLSRSGADSLGGTLDWLVQETEAEAVAYLELAPGGEEYLRTAPRGLGPETVSELVALARRALVEGEADDAPIDGARLLRWLGPGGSRVLLATDGSEAVAEPMRFARNMLGWMRTRPARDRDGDLEERLRRVRGVTWAEVREDRVLLLASEDAAAAAGREVERLLRRHAGRVEWIGEPPPAEAPPVEAPAEASSGDRAEASSAIDLGPKVRTEDLVTAGLGEEPRIRLLEVLVDEDGDITADVRVTWKEHEIRGRGHGRPGPSGRYFAAAQAVADALRPLLDTDIEVAGLYAASPHEGMQVIIAEVVLEGERFVGAVMERPEESDWTGARAILDAVNRRLVQVAGRSGRV
jgi:hypothetical protein